MRAGCKLLGKPHFFLSFFDSGLVIPPLKEKSTEGICLQDWLVTNANEMEPPGLGIV